MIYSRNISAFSTVIEQIRHQHALCTSRLGVGACQNLLLTVSSTEEEV
jgi:hypothetical protein